MLILTETVEVPIPTISGTTFVTIPKGCLVFLSCGVTDSILEIEFGPYNVMVSVDSLEPISEEEPWLAK